MFETALTPRRMAGLLSLALALVLSSCTVGPLYAPGPGGETVRADLAAISILPVDNRVGQVIRNELQFAFTGGGAPAPVVVYELSLSATTGGGGFNVTAPGNEASSGVSVTARYTLMVIATGEIIVNGTVRTETRYTRSNQAFANLRAEEDAQERAAREAAERIELDIAAALAARI